MKALKNSLTTKLLYLILLAFGCLEFGFSQVGINTTTPLSTLDINGNLNVKEIGVFNALVPGSGPLLGSANPLRTAISDGVYISITPQCSGGANDFQLPSAASFPGRIYIIRNISNSCSAFIFTAGGGLFPKNDFNAIGQPLVMVHNNASKTTIFISDGVNWTFIN
jgi:hypothetical protein